MKNYLVYFSNGATTASNAGLAPTFLQFRTVVGGATAVSPGITAISNTGLYYFTYGPTNSIAFVIDGATSGLGQARYINGMLDPIDAIDEYLGSTFYPMNVTITALGTSAIAQGVTLTYLVDGASGGLIEVLNRIGTTASSYGDTAVNPGTLYGFLKRLQEWNEGNSIFSKSTSLWDVYSRGSSTLLAEKTMNDSSGNVTKT